LEQAWHHAKILKRNKTLQISLGLGAFPAGQFTPLSMTPLLNKAAAYPGLTDAHGHLLGIGLREM